MSEIVCLRKPSPGDPTTLPEVIGLAFQKALRQAAISVVPQQQTRTILLNGVVDAAARGLRDVDRLSDAALDRLSAEEARNYGAYRRGANTGL